MLSLAFIYLNSIKEKFCHLDNVASCIKDYYSLDDTHTERLDGLVNFLLFSKKNILSEQQIAVYCIRAPILEDITQLAKEQNITIFEKQQISVDFK